MATATTAAETTEVELKTYWCHECDMSVSLTSSSPPLLCPHCHTHFLELMDSPFPPQNDAAPFDFIILQNDVVEDDPLSFLSSTLTASRKNPADSIPVITVTSPLLTQLDPNGVVFCAVCKDEIGVGSEAKQLPCNHLYHADCIAPWLAHHSSCPLCRFRLVSEEEEEEEDEEDEEEEEEEDGASARAREIRRQLRAAMVRLSELMEEEEDDFYGLRTTLNHIASRHGLVEGGNGSVSDEREVFGSRTGGGGGGGDEQALESGVTG